MTKIAAKWLTSIPNLWPTGLKNHTLWGRTYLYSPLPPGKTCRDFLLSKIMELVLTLKWIIMRVFLVAVINVVMQPLLGQIAVQWSKSQLWRRLIQLWICKNNIILNKIPRKCYIHFRCRKCLIIHNITLWEPIFDARLTLIPIPLFTE